MGDGDREEFSLNIIERILNHPKFKRIQLRMSLGTLISILIAGWIVSTAWARGVDRLEKDEATINQSRIDHEQLIMMSAQVDGMYKYLGLPTLEKPRLDINKVLP